LAGDSQGDRARLRTLECRNRIRKPERQDDLKNTYRVLLTRARQGMVIVVPEGEPQDPTRRAGYYDGTFEYLRHVGLYVV
jgi:hypothetical protein